METAEITDLYEAAYLVAQGCRVEGARCLEVSQSLACVFAITGEGVSAFLEGVKRKEARVNLYAFRAAYNQVHGLMRETKKAWGREKRNGGARW